EAMQRAGAEARVEARRSSLIVAGIGLATLLSFAGVLRLLTRSVVRPISELDQAVEAIRQDDLEVRVPVRSVDELGRLAAGFNRMAATLADSRREREERFRQVAENIHEIFWMVDARSDRVLYVSPGYEEVWGRTCQSLYEQPHSWIESIHPDDRGGAAAQMERQRRGVFTDWEFRIVRPDDSIRWVRRRAFPVKDQNQDLSWICALVEDITAPKRAEEALRESEARVRNLLLALPATVFTTEREGRITLFNDRAAALWGAARISARNCGAARGGLASPTASRCRTTSVRWRWRCTRIATSRARRSLSSDRTGPGCVCYP